MPVTESKSLDLDAPTGATGEGGADSPAGSQPQVILAIKSFKKRLNEKRIQVTFFNNESYSLDASRIKHIYFLNNVFYFIYETNNPQFYAKYSVSSLPELAISIDFEVREYIEERCTKCGSIIEWDADEPYCINCGPDPDFKEINVKEFILKADELKSELKNFVQLLGIEAEYIDTLYSTIAGGYTPLFKLSTVSVMLYTYNIEEIAIVENPIFEESHYDEISTQKHIYNGKYLVMKARKREFRTAAVYYVLFKIDREPRLDILEQLVRDEEERKKMEEEEKKRKEEEEKRKEEEEKRKWSDPNEVAKEIISKLPEWADGAYVKQKAVWGGEDAAIIVYVLPIKRSQRGSGFYTSESWNRVNVGIKSKYLEPLAGEVILRDGTHMKVREIPPKNGGKYIDLLLNS
jgi:hypothetical protein